MRLAKTAICYMAKRIGEDFKPTQRFSVVTDESIITPSDYSDITQDRGMHILDRIEREIMGCPNLKDFCHMEDATYVKRILIDATTEPLYLSILIDNDKIDVDDTILLYDMDDFIRTADKYIKAFPLTCDDLKLISDNLYNLNDKLKVANYVKNASIKYENKNIEFKVSWDRPFLPRGTVVKIAIIRDSIYCGGSQYIEYIEDDMLRFNTHLGVSGRYHITRDELLEYASHNADIEDDIKKFCNNNISRTNRYSISYEVMQSPISYNVKLINKCNNNEIAHKSITLYTDISKYDIFDEVAYSQNSYAISLNTIINLFDSMKIDKELKTLRQLVDGFKDLIIGEPLGKYKVEFTLGEVQ